MLYKYLIVLLPYLATGMGKTFDFPCDVPQGNQEYLCVQLLRDDGDQPHLAFSMPWQKSSVQQKQLRSSKNDADGCKGDLVNCNEGSGEECSVRRQGTVLVGEAVVKTVKITVAKELGESSQCRQPSYDLAIRAQFRSKLEDCPENRGKANKGWELQVVGAQNFEDLPAFVGVTLSLNESMVLMYLADPYKEALLDKDNELFEPCCMSKYQGMKTHEYKGVGVKNHRVDKADTRKEKNALSCRGRGNDHSRPADDAGRGRPEIVNDSDKNVAVPGRLGLPGIGTGLLRRQVRGNRLWRHGSEAAAGPRAHPGHRQRPVLQRATVCRKFRLWATAPLTLSGGPRSWDCKMLWAIIAGSSMNRRWRRW